MPKRKPNELSREIIARAALVLLDRHGLPGFSTRKLGAALGCEAMAIYWYYPNKDALLDAVVDRLIVPLSAVLDEACDDFVDTLRRIAHAYRAIAIDHPHAFPLLATRRFASEASYAFLDALFEHARAAGLSDREAARRYRSISSYVNGFALNELASRHLAAGAAGSRVAAGVAGSRRRRSALDRAFPRVAAINAHLEPQHLDALFESGLEMFLGALEARTAVT